MKRNCKVLFCLTATIVFTLALRYGVNSPPPLNVCSSLGDTVPKNSSQKVILVWTKYFRNENYFGANFSLLECKSCVFTYDRSLVNVADAVVFHWLDVDLQDLPPPKVDNSDQKWVMVNQESPEFLKFKSKTSIAKFLGPQIHWTMTYRRDSDIYTPYGRFRAKKDDTDNSFRLTEEEFNDKREVAWMVSSCETFAQRELFVQELSKHIPVDVYGACGNFSCRGTRKSCYSYLSDVYKFYLSFENAICQDYVTEKFYLALSAGMVPVVFGGASYEEIAPPGSFVDALTFRTPEDLADYLYRLSANFTLYRKYFEWREVYEIEIGDPYVHDCGRHLSGLCDKLHREGSRPSYYDTRRTKRNLAKWWFVEARCRRWVGGETEEGDDI